MLSLFVSFSIFWRGIAAAAAAGDFKSSCLMIRARTCASPYHGKCAQRSFFLQKFKLGARRKLLGAGQQGHEQGSIDSTLSTWASKCHAVVSSRPVRTRHPSVNYQIEQQKISRSCSFIIQTCHVKFRYSYQNLLAARKLIESVVRRSFDLEDTTTQSKNPPPSEQKRSYIRCYSLVRNYRKEEAYCFYVIYLLRICSFEDSR